MSTEGILFGRYAKLSIGLRNQKGVLIESISKDKDGKIVDGLRIKFKIEKTAEATPNKAHIDVYNLNPQTIKLLQTRGCTITLEVGYNNFFNGKNPTPEVIFKGDVVKCQTVKQGSDYVTTIENGDGVAALQNSQFNGSFAAGAGVSDVLSSVMGSFTGVGQGEVKGVDGQYLNGATFSGSSKDVMDQVTAKSGSEWNIQDNIIQVIPVNSFTKLPAILLQSVYDGSDRARFDEAGNPLNTGLIGSPSLSGFSNSKEKKFHGVEFKALLQAGLKVGRRVLISAKNVKGAFVIKKVTHEGDTSSGSWMSECEGVQI